VIESLDFPKVLSKYDSPNTVFYVDPPGECTENSSVYCISRRWKDSDVKKLADLLNQVKGKVILNHSIKVFLKKFYSEPAWNYTEYQLYDMPDKEVLICNFPVEPDIFSTLRKLKECTDEHYEELATFKRGEEVEAANDRPADMRGNPNILSIGHSTRFVATVPNSTTSGEKVGDTPSTGNTGQDTTIPSPTQEVKDAQNKM
jgi:hypothetical protein